MEVHCQNCSTVTELAVTFTVKDFACPQCQWLYSADENGSLKYTGRKYKHEITFEKSLRIGQKGTLNGTGYTVSGILVKSAYANFYWTEYMLQDAAGNFRYLSEGDGHWIFLEPIDKKYSVTHTSTFLTHEGMKMRLYDRCKAEIVGAKGFFDFSIAPQNIALTEFIRPPYVISIEQGSGENATFFGEHISRKTVKEAFGAVELREKLGVGLVQPFLIDLRNLAIVFCVTAIAILVTHMAVYSGRTSKTVTETIFTIGESNNKEYVSRPFTLQGGSAPLTIEILSDIDNSWLTVQVALVNESTSEEIYADQDVEYYHGYEGGESWSEGQKGETMQFCGVPEGTYHLLVTPMWAAENGSNNSMVVRAIWNQPSMWNAWFSIGAMGVLWTLTFFFNKNFEKRRWSDSDYSPYEE